MLRAFIFAQTSILVRHWFEIDLKDSSMEHGARVEVRHLDPQPHRGTESAAQRFVVDRPIWRADLFDRLNGVPGGFEAAHHHPVFDGVEPSARVYLDEDPWEWLRDRLGDIEKTCAAAGPPAEIAADAEAVRESAAEIVAAAQALAPARCDSVRRCHRWTADVAETVRLMAATTARPDRLDRARIAPWMSD